MEDNSSVFDSDIVKVDKYEPHKIANGKNEVTFFVASDEIDFADLQRYRIQAQTDYLIAISTTNKYYDCLGLADNVISCSTRSERSCRPKRPRSSPTTRSSTGSESLNPVPEIFIDNLVRNT